MNFISVLTIVFTLAIEDQMDAAPPSTTPALHASYPASTFTYLKKRGSQTMQRLHGSCSSFIDQFVKVLNLNHNNGINLNFNNFSLALFDKCTRVQLEDRLKIQYSALKTFRAPLRNIRRESPRRNLTTSLDEIQGNLEVLLMVFKNVLTTLRIEDPVNQTSASFSLKEMNRITKEYLRSVHPKVLINRRNIRSYRDLGFAYSLYSVLATIKQEFHQMFLIKNF